MQSCDMEHFKEAARDAEKSMRGVFERTPLQKNEHLSAIYGADAVAGVINTVLNRNFDGLSVKAKFTEFEK